MTEERFSRSRMLIGCGPTAGSGICAAPVISGALDLTGVSEHCRYRAPRSGVLDWRKRRQRRHGSRRPPCRQWPNWPKIRRTTTLAADAGRTSATCRPCAKSRTVAVREHFPVSFTNSTGKGSCRASRSVKQTSGFGQLPRARRPLPFSIVRNCSCAHESAHSHWSRRAP